MINKVELAEIELEDEWDESNTDTFASPTTRWFKEYEVYIKLHYDRQEGFFNRIVDTVQHRKRYPEFFIHASICSPAMVEDTPENLTLQNPIIQDSFNEESAISEIKKRIANITAVDTHDLESKLSKVLFVLPTIS